MNGYKSNEILLRQQSSTKGHEAQLLDARKQRKETDEQLQAMMNRIAFLAQEEVRLDRDIEAARRRAAEALARQATRDEDIVATAREVLAVMSVTAPLKRARPHTGRSSLMASLPDSSSTAPTSSSSIPAPSLPVSTTSQHSARSLESGPSTSSQLPTSPTPSMTLVEVSSAPYGASSGPAGSAGGPGSSCGGSSWVASGHPPRAPSASRGRAPVLLGRAMDKSNKLPPVAPAPVPGTPLLRSPSPGGRPGSASRPGTAGRARPSSISPTCSVSCNPPSYERRHSADAATCTAGAAVTAAVPPPLQPLQPVGRSGPWSGPLAAPGNSTTNADGLSSGDLRASGPTQSAGIQHLSGQGAAQHDPGTQLPRSLSTSCGVAALPLSRNVMAVIHGGEVTPDLPPALGAGGGGGVGAAVSARSAMTVIHGAMQAVGELDEEVLEELLRGGGGGSVAATGGGAAAGGPSGLQEFARESGRRVVEVKASRRTEAPSATVSAAGVGWGMGGRAASSIAPREARQLQAEMAKKQQIWKVRKTFGLEPTPMADRSAQVEELGAGAWQ